MSYTDEVERLLAGFSKEEKIALVERLEINLYKPEQMLRSRHVFNENRKRIREIEKRALKKLHPEIIYPEPEGPECSLCGVSENEVNDMAKHELGFNICSECIGLCAQVLREEGTE